MILRDFLRSFIGLSRNMIKILKFEGGQILVNDEIVNVRTRLTTGDQVEVIFPMEERAPSLKPEAIELEIVYEDDFILIINKPAKMPVIPSMTYPSGTIANGLIAYYDQLGLDYTAHIVTRLDRNTSGLMLVAKQQFCHSLFHKVEIDRYYQAIVKGEIQEKGGTIDAPIGRDPDSIIARTVRKDGQKAITHYQVIRHNDESTIVDIQLETGRTHQIRVHFAHLGHPLLGDDLYGGPVEQIDRQALHCVSLAFTHPVTKEKLSFHSEWPPDMASLV
ncbi:RluA family pseudouridine synthase [Amphibacillus sp. MSJ-3]|uniref:RluA family pseudouridine synthase n=1 Tax=Amphibacillus sp. MSJ-3 TaxID=2841505 RepID=UPI001C0EB18A|nr:RluA family pseudouridine synthase [Amphibacillus sp. MSJ-3]MBU5595204.1 RluA family pseudouridine synthase [Amphibacillus sp. MSJ-3]